MSTTIPTLRLGAADAGRVVSSDEFAHAEFAEPYRYERVDGRLVVMSPKSPEHDDVLEPWIEAVIEYKRAHRSLVENVVTEAWIRVSHGSDRIADLAVYLRSPRSRFKRPDRVPEFVVEVVSGDRASQERDYVSKTAEYRALGVLEYVIVDRFQQRVTVHRCLANGAQTIELGREDRFESAVLPGFVFDVGAAE